ncbi:hypothetical protein [Sphingomonas sp.]|uniref:hypothetical protein n=1 Tax=Sphingomonas sp. TaxID=28214 RepID=UPI001ED1092B|nr:hypothetical protein [Sphingomonas sp.]MBX3593176.1 hypothetical protein [Sphingomonas sp.]
MSKAVALLPVALGAAAFALMGADAAPTGAFRIETVQFEVAPPPGYCLSSDREVAIDRRIAAADRMNVTHLSVHACGTKPPWRSYFLVKTPVQLLRVVTTTAELQAAVWPELVRGFDSRAIETRSSDQATRVLGARTTVKGEMVPLGKDESCLYLGGVIDVRTPERKVGYTLSVAGCMTVVGGRVMTIYRYAPGTTMDSVRALMPSARAFAAAINVRDDARR